jgi:hypothetical protein
LLSFLPILLTRVLCMWLSNILQLSLLQPPFIKTADC